MTNYDKKNNGMNLTKPLGMMERANIVANLKNIEYDMKPKSPFTPGEKIFTVVAVLGLFLLGFLTKKGIDFGTAVAIAALVIAPVGLVFTLLARSNVSKSTDNTSINESATEENATVNKSTISPESHTTDSTENKEIDYYELLKRMDKVRYESKTMEEKTLSKEELLKYLKDHDLL